MTKTEEMFGKPASHYAHLQAPLAAEKIADAKQVIRDSIEFMDYSGSEQDMRAYRRINKATKAIQHWEEIQELE